MKKLCTIEGEGSDPTSVANKLNVLAAKQGIGLVAYIKKVLSDHVNNNK
jgi:predicted HicB family RNase H-like nuclease